MISSVSFSFNLCLILFLLPVSLLAQQISFDAETHPLEPAYSVDRNWSALPFRADAADALPKEETWISDSLKNADVFYVHPTIYTKGSQWNAGLDMEKINKKVDKYPVRLQASVFNASCRVFAPRYRQAIVDVFYHPTEDGDKALDLAYSDVKRAFEYYLKHHNNGRPFIIAGHSQGTYHTRRLLKEMIDTTDLRKQLVAAYIIGFTVNEGMFSNLKMCQNATATGCFLSWSSYREGYHPGGRFYKKTESVNPLIWTTDTTRIVHKNYDGTVVLNTQKIKKRTLSVRITDIGGKVLWVETKAPLFRLLKDLHIADYGLFYMDIRKNVKQRVVAYLGNRP